MNCFNNDFKNPYKEKTIENQKFSTTLYYMHLLIFFKYRCTFSFTLLPVEVGTQLLLFHLAFSPGSPILSRRSLSGHD